MRNDQEPDPFPAPIRELAGVIPRRADRRRTFKLFFSGLKDAVAVIGWQIIESLMTMRKSPVVLTNRCTSK